MTAIEKAQKKADAVLAAARKEYAGIQSEIDAYALKRDTAEAEMERAGDNADLAAYNAAKKELEDAQTALTMYTSRKEKLEGKSLLTEKEYKSLVSGILEEVDTYFDGLKEEMFSISKTLEAKHSEAAEKINSANKILHTLQYDCFRGLDLIYHGNLKSPDPSSIYKAGSRPQWDIVAWAGRLNESATYQEMKKEEEKNE